MGDDKPQRPRKRQRRSTKKAMDEDPTLARARVTQHLLVASLLGRLSSLLLGATTGAESPKERQERETIERLKQELDGAVMDRDLRCVGCEVVRWVDPPDDMEIELPEWCGIGVVRLGEPMSPGLMQDDDDSPVVCAPPIRQVAIRLLPCACGGNAEFYAMVEGSDELLYSEPFAIAHGTRSLRDAMSFLGYSLWTADEQETVH